MKKNLFIVFLSTNPKKNLVLKIWPLFGCYYLMKKHRRRPLFEINTWKMFPDANIWSQKRRKMHQRECIGKLSYRYFSSRKLTEIQHKLQAQKFRRKSQHRILINILPRDPYLHLLRGSQFEFHLKKGSTGGEGNKRLC